MMVDCQSAPMRPMVDPGQVVELSWPLLGESIPLEHGYLLYSALALHVEALHHADRPWQVAPVRGERAGDQLRLLRDSRLRIRAPIEDIPTLLALSGARLRFARSVVELGPTRIEVLTPRCDLHARIVVIKSSGVARAEEGPFWTSLCKQAAALGLDPKATRLETGRRRVMRIHGYSVVGWEVRAYGLSPAASLALQAHGLGAKRRMGCGVFL